MVFVRPSAFVYQSADLLQKFGVLISLTSLLHYSLFILSPFVTVPFLT